MQRVYSPCANGHYSVWRLLKMLRLAVIKYMYVLIWLTKFHLEAKTKPAERRLNLSLTLY